MKNRTGSLISPIESIDAQEGAEEFTLAPSGDATLLSENRIYYMQEADTLGSVPLTSEKMGPGFAALMDKLGERLAFERSGVRLYEALISKHQGSLHKENLPPLSMLVQFHQEELMHFYLVTDIMNELGGDATAVTPAADISGVASSGWVQVITDPRTTFLQSLEVILQAELVDNVGWEVLRELAVKEGLKDIARQFKMAMEEETIHLVTVKQWVQELILGRYGVAPAHAYMF